MYIQLKNYHNANEILYVLKSVNDNTNQSIAKIGVQKLLYLSASLAPIKNVALSILQFLSEKRGPYSKEIQNTLDNLVAYDLVKITEYKVYSNKASIAYYQITDGGIAAANSLIKYDKEEEIWWWIDIIVRVANLYTEEEELVGISQFTGMDKIVKLVYQDPTFKSIRSHQGRYAMIDLENSEGLTYDLIMVAKEYLIKNQFKFNLRDDRYKAEFILLAFFEFLFSKYLSEVI